MLQRKPSHYMSLVSLPTANRHEMDNVVLIHIDLNFSDIPQLANYTSSLFTITSYLPKILNAILVKSE